MARLDVDAPRFLSGAPVGKSRAVDWTRALACIYDLGADDDQWLEAVLESLRVALDRRFGVFAWFFDAPWPRVIKVRRPVFLEGPEELYGGMNDWASRMRLGRMVRFHDASAVSSVTEGFGAPLTRATAPRLSALGVQDLLFVRALGDNSLGCALAAPSANPINVHSRTRQLLQRLTEHLVVAQRMRRLEADPSEHPEAIFTERGECLDAVPHLHARGARTNLASLVCQLQTAQRMLPTDPGQALEIWKGVLDGGWSIVRKTDVDGKRLLLVRRNPKPVAPPLALSSLEGRIVQGLAQGHSQKSLAFELGLQASAVSELAKSGLRKIGLDSPLEAIRVLGRRGATAGAISGT